ncbi:MAG: cyanoexosortase B system-associated protein [Cyanobacteria bacterium SID2]|nr:cyanoexosortase B system-associated protein [Cyanobacteria bacterium SID2]MBP0003273.1 cyanoexosortase B system-associated protein [Cyanobacteria bacterium SBC]
MDKSASLPKILRRSSPFAVAAVVFLLLVLLVGAVPNYLSGQLPAREPPQVNLQGLKNLEETGLSLSGWTTVDLMTVNLGSGQWVMQTLMWDDPASPAEKPGRATVLLHAQQGATGTRSQPQMEWTDVRGLGNAQGDWNEDSHQRLQFEVETEDNRTAEVSARFFRGWTPQQTYAIVQWYAWDTGGHPNLTNWFWVDRSARLAGERKPWVAVCLIAPIEPLGDIKNAQPLLESLSSRVQLALMEDGFTASP